MIQIDCPQCQKRYRLDEALAGKTVQCRECDASFQVDGESAVEAELVEESVVDAEVVEAELVPSKNGSGGSMSVTNSRESTGSEPIQGTTPDLSYEISQRPDYAMLKLDLKSGDKVFAEPSAMMSMSASMLLKSGLRGGLGRSLGRMFGGESLVVNTFTAQAGGGELLLAPGTAGDIAYKRLENSTLYLQRGAYMANTEGVDLTGKWQGARGFFSGEGLVLLKASGTGDLFFNSYGAIMSIDVTDEFIVDTGYIVAFEETLQYRVTVLPGLKRGGKIKSLLFGGEGLVCQFSGQGKVWIQTREVNTFLNFANAYRPSRNNN